MLAVQVVDQLVGVESVVFPATVAAPAGAEERLSNLAELVNIVVDLNQVVLFGWMEV